MKVVINGRVASAEQAVISVFDHGFLYGFGLFETLRTYNGEPFLFERHYARLKRAAESYRIDVHRTARDLYNDIQLALRENRLQDAYIRVTLSSGDQGLGLWGDRHRSPNWIVMAKSIGPLPPSKRLVSLRLRRSTHEGDFRTKSLSFANNMLAKKELYERGKDDHEGIFLSEQGYIVEGVASNLFFVRNGALFTPHEETGLLPGITRDFVIELARSLNIETHEGFYTLKELREADEIFLTNSIQEIMPASQLDGAPLKIVGPITQRLTKAYQSAIAKQGEVAHDESDS